jgi:hypothetical protein
MPRQERPELIANINRAFSAENIAQTANRLTPLRPRADVFNILDTLGFLNFVRDHNIALYRRRVGIPTLNQRVLTLAFRTSLLNRRGPIPLHFNIVSGPREVVDVTTSDRLISVELIRIDPPE